MRSFIVTTEDGKTHAVIASNIKSVEHVPGKPGVPAQPAQEAREGSPGVPVVHAVAPRPGHAGIAGRPGKPPVAAQEAKEAVKGDPGVPDGVIIHLVDGESLKVQGLTQQQVVDHINSDTVVGGVVLGSAAPAQAAQQTREGRPDALGRTTSQSNPQTDGLGRPLDETQRQDLNR